MLSGVDEDEALKCIRCGLCQSVCPVFDAVGTEPSAARGKVQMIRALGEGRLSASEALRRFVFLCLNCGACTATCPSAVKVSDLIVETRARLLAQLGQPFVERLVLRGLAADSARLAVGAKILALYQRTGLRWLARKVGLLNAISDGLCVADGSLPTVPLRSARKIFGPLAGPSGSERRVIYFVGCTTDLFDHDVGRAVISVLARRGCRVVIPDKLECCGMPHRNFGDFVTAAALEKRNTEQLNAIGAEAIVVDCATCGSVLKRYEGLSLPVYDISEYLVDVLGLEKCQWAKSAIVTYHDPCHLVRAQGISAAPRELLRSVDGLTLREMAEADRCCGGGGSFGLTHYDISMKILDRKITNIAATGAEVIASGCPSCRMQLRYGLLREAERNSRIAATRVVHPVELVAAAIVG